MPPFLLRRLHQASTARILVPAVVQRPAGASPYGYRALVEIRNLRGEMTAPDSDTVYLRILTAGKIKFAGETRLKTISAVNLPDSTNSSFPHATGFWVEQTTSISAGRFEALFSIEGADSEQHVTVELGWISDGSVNIQSARCRISDAADLDVIDANIDSILVDTGTTIPATLSGMEAKIDAVDTVVDSTAIDVTNVETKADAILLDTGTTLPATLSTIEGKIDAVVEGARKVTFTEYLVDRSSDLRAVDDPQSVQQAETATTTSWEVLFVKEIALPEGSGGLIVDVHVTLDWYDDGTVVAGTGAGSTQWYMSPTSATETVGAAPTGSAVLFTSGTNATTTKTQQQMSGRPKAIAIPANSGFKLVLAGKVITNTDIVKIWVDTSAKVEVTYTS